MTNISSNGAVQHHPTVGVLMKAPRISRDLGSAEGWLREMAGLYRQARRGQLSETSACRLAYLCSVAARLAKDVEELRQAEAIRAQLERLGNESSVVPVSRDVPQSMGRGP